MSVGRAATRLALPLQAGDRFGSSIAILDNLFLVGAPGDGWHANIPEAGAAYLLSYGERTDELLFNTLSVLTEPSPGPYPSAAFGTSVALTRDSRIADGYFVVGAPKTRTEPTIPLRFGAAYLFSFNLTQSRCWSSVTSRFINCLGVTTRVERRFTSDTPRSDNNFGQTVAFHEGLLFVGESGLDVYPSGVPAPHHNGNVYVYDVTSGMLRAKLTPIDPVSGTGVVGCFGFGASLAVTHGLLAVGSPRAKGPCGFGTKWGAAWVFETHNWTQVAKLMPERGEQVGRSEFGTAVAWQPRWDNGGKLLLVGAPGLGVTATGGTALGAVYSFLFTPADDPSLLSRVAATWPFETARLSQYASAPLL